MALPDSVTESPTPIALMIAASMRTAAGRAAALWAMRIHCIVTISPIDVPRKGIDAQVGNAPPVRVTHTPVSITRKAKTAGAISRRKRIRAMS